MRTNYVLIDFENVHVKSLDLVKDEHFRVIVFLGPKNTKLPVELVLAMQQLGTRGEYVMLETPGTNALDFHMAFHLGRLAAEDPSGFFHIISKDTGFDPLIQHLKARKIFSARSPSIEEMACFRTAVSSSAAVGISQGERGNLNTERFDELCSQAIVQLIAMKKAKPSRLSTLHSTIQAKLGKDVPASTVDMVCSELVKRGLVKTDGERIVYAMAE
ncbi:PIN domain-containing protein [Thauera sp. Sel9]|uniref:PIN domain-containing protein n=1 Tax=Thauera sp. Sel9 TaxID=2974299 RepID=UPI0021E1797D|nr:PIN domain-containing protein [Thauera sp. Sel9]MCV2216945.1 PIN domain-containing protein [Thauera sp. Sel9]